MGGTPCSKERSIPLQYCWITHFCLGISIQPGSVAHYGQMQGFVLCFVLVESAGLCPQEVCLFSWKDRRCVGHWDGVFSLSRRWDLGGNVQPASSLSLCLCLSFPAWSLLVTPGLGLCFCRSLSCLWRCAGCIPELWLLLLEDVSALLWQGKHPACGKGWDCQRAPSVPGDLLRSTPWTPKTQHRAVSQWGVPSS